MSLAFKHQQADHHVFEMVAKIVSEITGIQLGERQRPMVESRLRRRMAEVGASSEDAYVDYFNSHSEAETQALISLLTTHHSYFFREFSHFEYLEQNLLPRLVAVARARADKKIHIWSAACSRGQEVYSLAMCISAWLRENAKDVTYEIVGTDVDPESVKLAKNGVYHYRDIKEVPIDYMGNHWARGTGQISDYVKAKPSIRNHCHFWPENLLALSPEIQKRKFDVIFCRNVFIYFNPDQIKKIVGDLSKLMTPEGFLFIGISESLHGMGLPLDSKGPSIYTGKHNAKPALVAKTAAAPAAPAPSAAKVDYLIPNPLRVLCVDDSGSILTLLKQILKPEFGFEVIGTASNGLDAAQKLKTLTPHLMTLDIHMPEQNGIDYLKANMNEKHPPVVMLTSVSRDNEDLAMTAFKNGAYDYVEKPALADLGKRAEEIRAKLRSAYRNQMKMKAKKHLTAVDKAFQHKLKLSHPEKAIRLMFAHLSDREQLKVLLTEFTNQPPTVIVVDGSDASLRPFAKDFATHFAGRVSILETGLEPLQKDHIYLADFKKCFDNLKGMHFTKPSSIMVLGEPTPAMIEKIPLWTNAQLLVEDDPGLKEKLSTLREIASDTVPVTSYPYMSMQFLAEKEGHKK